MKKKILGSEEKILPTLKSGIHMKKRLFTEIKFSLSILAIQK